MNYVSLILLNHSFFKKSIFFQENIFVIFQEIEIFFKRLVDASKPELQN